MMSKSKSTIAVFVGIALLVVGAAVGGYYAFSNEYCTRTVKDSHDPILEIKFASSETQTQLGEDQLKALEKGFLDLYNDETGGCSAEYKRWMYGMNVMEQTVSKHAVMEDEVESSIAHTFDNEYNLVLRLGTKISCDGCVDDEAFASVYPATFGSSARRLEQGENGLSADRMFSGFAGIISKAGLGQVSSMSLITNDGRHSSVFTGRSSRGSKGSKASDARSSSGSKGSKGSDARSSTGTKGTKSIADAIRGADEARGQKGIKASNPQRSSLCGGSKSKGKGKGKGFNQLVTDISDQDCVESPPRAAPETTLRPTRFVYTPQPTRRPTNEPVPAESREVTPQPTRFIYTPQPTYRPTPEPTPEPTPSPVDESRVFTPQPTRFVYTPQPTNKPTPEPTPLPTPNPTPDPTPQPTPVENARVLTPQPTRFTYTPEPTNKPTPEPTPLPTPNPTPDPTPQPTPVEETRVLTPQPTPFPFQKFTVPPFAAASACPDDPCELNFSDDAATSCDENVQKLVAIDSWCGVRWDPWCVVAYNDCFEESICDPAGINEIAVDGGVDRTRIKCPANVTDASTNVTKGVEPIAGAFAEEPTCPENFPGSGAACELTNLQCYYAYGDIVWLCNCGADPMAFFCRPKDQ